MIIGETSGNKNHPELNGEWLQDDACASWDPSGDWQAISTHLLKVQGAENE